MVADLRIEVGEIVRVARTVGFVTERELRDRFPDRRYVLRGYSNPHGYAVIEGDDHERWLVHPEALEIAPPLGGGA